MRSNSVTYMFVLGLTLASAHGQEKRHYKAVSSPSTGIWASFAVKDIAASPRVVETTFYSTTVNADVSIAVPGYDSVGDVCRLTADTVLLSGMNAAGNGVISTVKLIDGATPSVLVGATSILTGIDPYGVYWNPNDLRVFIWDDAAKRVRTALWPGLGSNLPTTYSLVSETTPTIPLSRFDQGIEIGSPSDSPLTSGAHINNPSAEGIVPWSTFEIVLDQGVWTVKKVTSVPGVQSKYIGIYEARTWKVNAGGQVNLHTRGPADLVALVDVLNGSQLVTWSLPSNVVTLVTLPSVLWDWPGRRYRVDSSQGSESSASFRPLARHGEPIPGAGLAPYWGQINANEVLVGGVIQPNVSLQPAHVADGTHNVWLVFNFRNSDGSDPVTTIGTNAYQLTPLAIIPYTASLGFKHPTTMKEIPIPPDPNLDYSVLLFQFIIESPTMNVCASEVFGTTIWPEGGEPVALPPGPTLAKQSSRGTTIPETSLRRFIKSAGGMLVTRPAANGFLRACARLRASAQKR